MSATLAETLAQIGAVLEDYPPRRGTLMLHFDTDAEMSEAASALGFTGIAERVKAGEPFHLSTVSVGDVDVLCFGPSGMAVAS